MTGRAYDVIVVGGGHAGVEAAWAVAGMGGRVALVTMDPDRIGAMSCNPAIGGLAKGQMVREIDALGGLMGRAADATGIQFRVLNVSKGPAVRGPRCQSDKYAYARKVQEILRERPGIEVVRGTVDELIVEQGRCRGAAIVALGRDDDAPGRTTLFASAVVLTTGTFMRGLMHTGEAQSEGGRVGESAAVGISHDLRRLGFELGRLKTGTPPRLAADSIDFDALPLQPGDDRPLPFSDLTDRARFPVLEQRPCHITHTNDAIHALIRANLERAPMYNGQIETTGPRYCPSIEDKVVRFADRSSHHVYLEPESLDTDEIYCNGISTSLPADIQEQVVRGMPGCARARILRYGYAVEYDMVRPHQIDATTMTKRVRGLLLAGQINGTSGYEEAAGQGLLAGVNAMRHAAGRELIRLRRDQAYIGVMMDDLVTKTPREPYRMFTSRAEHRLLLRADNAAERLTGFGRELGLVDDERWRAAGRRRDAIASLRDHLEAQRLQEWAAGPEVTTDDLESRIDPSLRAASGWDPGVVGHVLAEIKYAGYIERQQRQISRMSRQEARSIPDDLDYTQVTGLRHEARAALEQFRPATIGQAGRLAAVTPADAMVLTMAVEKEVGSPKSKVEGRRSGSRP